MVVEAAVAEEGKGEDVEEASNVRYKVTRHHCSKIGFDGAKGVVLSFEWAGLREEAGARERMGLAPGYQNENTPYSTVGTVQLCAVGAVNLLGLGCTSHGDACRKVEGISCKGWPKWR